MSNNANMWTIRSATWANSATTTTTDTLAWTYPGSTITIRQAPALQTAGHDWYVQMAPPDKIPAQKGSYTLPDGAKLEVDEKGNYRIEDKDAKVIYRANRIRDWSPHLNASDLLAQFVKYVGSLGVKQAEVLGLPLELFVNWLIIEAAERDQDPVPEDVVRVDRHQAVILARRPKCLACGRFIPRLYHQHRFPFCRPEHGLRWIERERQRQIA